MFDVQKECWDVLCGLTGEEVIRAVTDFHGLQILNWGFREFLADEGYLE